MSICPPAQRCRIAYNHSQGGGKFSILTTDEAYFLQFGFSTLTSPTTDEQFKPMMNTLSGGDQLGHSCMPAPNFATDFNLTAGKFSFPFISSSSSSY